LVPAEGEGAGGELLAAVVPEDVPMAMILVVVGLLVVLASLLGLAWRGK